MSDAGFHTDEASATKPSPFEIVCQPLPFLANYRKICCHFIHPVGLFLTLLVVASVVITQLGPWVTVALLVLTAGSYLGAWVFSRHRWSGTLIFDGTAYALEKNGVRIPIQLDQIKHFTFNHNNYFKLGSCVGYSLRLTFQLDSGSVIRVGVFLNGDQKADFLYFFTQALGIAQARSNQIREQLDNGRRCDFKGWSLTPEALEVDDTRYPYHQLVKPKLSGGRIVVSTEGQWEPVLDLDFSADHAACLEQLGSELFGLETAGKDLGAYLRQVRPHSDSPLGALSFFAFIGAVMLAWTAPLEPPPTSYYHWLGAVLLIIPGINHVKSSIDLFENGMVRRSLFGKWVLFWDDVVFIRAQAASSAFSIDVTLKGDGVKMVFNTERFWLTPDPEPLFQRAVGGAANQLRERFEAGDAMQWYRGATVNPDGVTLKTLTGKRTHVPFDQHFRLTDNYFYSALDPHKKYGMKTGAPNFWAMLHLVATHLPEDQYQPEEPPSA